MTPRSRMFVTMPLVFAVCVAAQLGPLRVGPQPPDTIGSSQPKYSALAAETTSTRMATHARSNRHTFTPFAVLTPAGAKNVSSALGAVVRSSHAHEGGTPIIRQGRAPPLSNSPV